MSSKVYDDTMNLKMYKFHVSYIKNLVLYSKTFTCRKCERNFYKLYLLKRHYGRCGGVTKAVYPGKFFKKALNVFEKLEMFNIHIEKDQRIYPWFTVFDFESMLVKKNLRLDNGKLTKTHQHVPISVAVCSNVEPYTKAKAFVSESPSKLTEEILSYLRVIQKKCYLLAKKKWGYVMTLLEKLLQKHTRKSYADDEKIPPSERMTKRVKIMMGEFDQFMKQAVILGYNNSSYDNNLVRYHLIRKLRAMDEKRFYVIKKTNRYISISNEYFRILDCMNYVAANCSYEKYLAAYDVEAKKGNFCYEFLDSFAKLSYP